MRRREPGIMTDHAHPTTRRPLRPACPSSADDSPSRCPDAGACDRAHRGRDPSLHDRTCGSPRWAIRRAEPCRIGPYRAQRRARSGPTVWVDLQAFRRLKAPRTPCFTRERSLVRNQPRPSKTVGLAGISWASLQALASGSVGLRRDRVGRPHTALVRIYPCVPSSDTREVAGVNPAAPIDA
jgi:hypothetical protein